MRSDLVPIDGWNVPMLVYLFATKEQGESWKQKKVISKDGVIILTKNRMVQSDYEMIYSLLEDNPSSEIMRFTIITDNLKEYQWSLKDVFFKQDQLVRLSTRNHLAYHGQIPFSEVVEIEDIKIGGV